MSGRIIPVDLVATMRLPRDPEKALRLDLAGLKWRGQGFDEFGPVDPALLDLLEIARVVHEFDRKQPKRTTGVRPKRVRVKMPVRVPRRWTAAVKAELCALLRVQGNAEWIFEFTKRDAPASVADLLFATKERADAATVGGRGKLQAPAVEVVVLFSGGLDSTCGLSTLAKEAGQTLLVGYYGRNRAKQIEIARKLGFSRFVQITSEWTTSSVGRSGGQFLYRSFLFLSLAAVFSGATNARSLLQFENGPLALAVPPLDIYRITRHAHPIVHQHFENLVSKLTRRPLSVANPFLAKTKGEAASLLRAHLSKADYKQVIGWTESCWYLGSRTIVAGPPRKNNGQPCGACVPCLVRKVALGDDEVKTGADFKNGRGPIEADPVVRIHYEAYSAFVQRLLDKGYGLNDFMAEIPAATRTALNGSSAIGAQAAFDLYRRFAHEWIRTFT